MRCRLSAVLQRPGGWNYNTVSYLDPSHVLVSAFLAAYACDMPFKYLKGEKETISCWRKNFRQCQVTS